MNSLVVIYIAAALMACVAIACTTLCLAWSIPSWRRRLARPYDSTLESVAKPSGLKGWAACVASGIVSTGSAACAMLSWYGCYCILSELNSAVR